MKSPDRKLKFEWNIYVALFALLFSGAMFLIPSNLYRQIFRQVTPPLILIVICGTALIYVDQYYRSWKYELRKDYLIVKKGVMHENKREIRYDKIEEVDIVRTAREKLLDLYRLNLFTESGKKLVLKGLTKKDAEELQNELIRNMN